MKKFLFALLAIIGVSTSCTSNYEEWILNVRDESNSYVVSAAGRRFWS